MIRLTILKMKIKNLNLKAATNQLALYKNHLESKVEINNNYKINKVKKIKTKKKKEKNLISYRN